GLLAAGARELTAWSKWWRGAKDESPVKKLAEDADTVKQRLKDMLNVESNTDIMAGLRGSLKTVKEQIGEVEDKFKKMREGIEGRRGVFTSAIVRGAIGSTEALARTGQEGI